MAGTRATERLPAVLLACSISAAVTGCDTDESAQPIRLAGAQVDGQDLTILFGGTCTDLETLDVQLTRDRSDAADEQLDTWSLSAGAGEGSLSEVTLGAVPEGFQPEDPLQVSWTDADFVRLSLTLADDERGLVLDVPELVQQAPAHEGEWYVNNLSEVTGGDASSGWYTEDGYRDLLDPDDSIVPLCGS